MDIEKEVEEIIEAFEEDKEATSVELHCGQDTTVTELINLCDVFRQKGYEPWLSFSIIHPEEDKIVMVSLTSLTEA